MRVYSALFILAILFTSCDDGDIIVTTFEFEDEVFNMCSDERDKVLYHINNEDVFETLTVQLTNSSFSNEDNKLISGLASLSLPLDDNSTTPIRIVLTGNNEVIYRTYDGTIPTSGYFCRDIPPASPQVLQEYRSVGGEIIITTNIIYNTSSQGLDNDGDGILSSLEGMDSLQDTDGDGTPDYLDRDDDGDNVSTTIERTVSDDADPTAEGYSDTDEDGIPNFLDPDDDDDGVPTIREITEEYANPAQNFNEARDKARYLDRFTTVRFEGEVSPLEVNAIPVRYTSVVEAQNLKLQNQGGDGEEISFVSKILGVYNSQSVSTPVTVDDTEEENTEDEETEETDEG